MEKKWWPLLSKEELSKILISFIFIAVIGGYLNYSFQRQTWERQVNYELLKNELADEKNTVSELTSLVEERLYATKQLIWASKDGKSLENYWHVYMEAVNKWNINNKLLQTKLVQISDYETAAQFLTYEDDLNNTEPSSIHYKFYKIHEDLLFLKKCYHPTCNKEKEIKNLEEKINTLTEQETNLIVKLNEVTIKKYNNLKLNPFDYLK